MDAELRTLERKAQSGGKDELLDFVKAAVKLTSPAGGVADLEAKARLGGNADVIRWVKAALGFDDEVMAHFHAVRERLVSLDAMVEEAKKKSKEAEERAAEVAVKAAEAARSSLEQRLSQVSEDAAKASGSLLEAISRADRPAVWKDRLQQQLQEIQRENVFTKVVPQTWGPDGQTIPEVRLHADPAPPPVTPDCYSGWPYVHASGWNHRAKPPTNSYDRDQELYWRAIVLDRLNELSMRMNDVVDALKQAKVIQ